MEKITLVATATFGIESIVADELKRLGYKDLKVNNGKVEFEGELKDICKANIWLRCADRVYLKMGEFEATTFDELFEKTKALHWDSILPVDAKFPAARVTSVKSKLFSKSDCQAIVKKAVVESMKKRYKVDKFEETGDSYDICIQILDDIVTLYIDTSGEGLHKRGYRANRNEAPIKETLAAAMVKIARWDYKTPIVDPFCGTATILIEAGMMARNIAPGGNRTFAAESWGIIDQKIWQDIRYEACTLEKKTGDLMLYGSDIDEAALKTARENIELAGLSDMITLSKKSADCIKEEDYGGKKGSIITNPPYGERISEKEDAEAIYKKLGRNWKTNMADWKYFLITSNEYFERIFGSKADKNRKLYNGGLKCYYYQYLS